AGPNYAPPTTRSSRCPIPGRPPNPRIERMSADGRPLILAASCASYATSPRPTSAPSGPRLMTASPRANLPSPWMTPAGSRLLPLRKAATAPASIVKTPLGSSEPAIHFFRAVIGLAGVTNQVQRAPSAIALSGCATRPDAITMCVPPCDLAGVSVRRVEDITEALWGTRVSPSTVSDLNKKIYGTIEARRNRPIEGEHPYVYLDGIVLKRSWAGEVRNVSLLVAIGVNESGYREILGICEGAKEDKTGWSAFLKHLKERGLKGVRLITSDACIGLAESTAARGRLAKVYRALVPQHL